MKTFKLFTILFLAVFISCSNDDDNNMPSTSNDDPVWNLTNVVGGFAGVNQNFPEGLITWTFNDAAQMLVVVNNNTDDTLNDFFDSGSYPYSINNNGVDTIISINGLEFGTMIERSDELIIDQQVPDSFVLTFTN